MQEDRGHLRCHPGQEVTPLTEPQPPSEHRSHSEDGVSVMLLVFVARPAGVGFRGTADPCPSRRGLRLLFFILLCFISFPSTSLHSSLSYSRLLSSPVHHTGVRTGRLWGHHRADHREPHVCCRSSRDGHLCHCSPVPCPACPSVGNGPAPYLDTWGPCLRHLRHPHSRPDGPLVSVVGAS